MNSIKTEMKDKGVFLITLNRPKVLNSLNKEIIDELLAAFDQAYQDAEIRTVVLTGEGRGFVAVQIWQAVAGHPILTGLQVNQRQMLWKLASIR